MKRLTVNMSNMFLTERAFLPKVLILLRYQLKTPLTMCVFTQDTMSEHFAKLGDFLANDFQQSSALPKFDGPFPLVGLSAQKKLAFQAGSNWFCRFFMEIRSEPQVLH